MAISSPPCPEVLSAERHGPHTDPARESTAAFPGRTEVVAPASAWPEDMAGRLLFCLLLVLGLCYAVLAIATAMLGFVSESTATVCFAGRTGLAVFAGLQGCAVMALTPLVGIGHRQGALHGVMLGLGTGLIIAIGLAAGWSPWFIQAFLPGTEKEVLARVQHLLILLPSVHAVAGLLGGALGSRLWPPLPPLQLPPARPTGDALARRAKQANEAEARPRLPWAGPIAWSRVGVGILIAVVGTISAGQILQAILDASEGHLKIATATQNRVTLGEVLALSLVLGGCAAGAGTANGLKQGLCVGVGAVTVIFFLMLAGVACRPGDVPIPLYWAVLLGPVGGWFGTELLPPVQADGRTRRRIWQR